MAIIKIIIEVMLRTSKVFVGHWIAHWTYIINAITNITIEAMLSTKLVPLLALVLVFWKVLNCIPPNPPPGPVYLLQHHCNHTNSFPQMQDCNCHNASSYSTGMQRLCGAMDSALDFGSKGCGFESHRSRFFSTFFFLSHVIRCPVRCGL